MKVDRMRVLENIQQYDLRMLLWFGRTRYFPHLIGTARAVSRTGDGYLQVFLPLALLISYPQLGEPFANLVIAAFIIERPLYFVLKNTLKRRRPPEALPDFTSIIQASDQFSFPSGHTMAAFLFAGVATLHFGAAALPIYLWAGAVGCSRVILGVHFPSDILAGAAIGTLIAIGAPGLL